MNKQQLEAIIDEIVQKRTSELRKEIATKLRIIERDLHDRITQLETSGGGSKNNAIVKKEMEMQVKRTFEKEVMPQINNFMTFVSYKTMDSDEVVNGFRSRVVGANNAKGQKQIGNGQGGMQFGNSRFVFTDND